MAKEVGADGWAAARSGGGLSWAESVAARLRLLPKSAEGVRESMAGDPVIYINQPGKGDLSDGADLMDFVEALCRIWPVREPHNDSACKLQESGGKAWSNSLDSVPTQDGRGESRAAIMAACPFC